MPIWTVSVNGKEEIGEGDIEERSGTVSLYPLNMNI